MTPSPARKSTIKQVAERAAVSIKTVSRVLNNERYISDDVRHRVEQAIRELAFQPSQAARALAGKRSHQVALICDNPSPYYVYEMQSGVRAQCLEANVRMIAQPYDRNSVDLRYQIEQLIDQTNPDGLILTPPITDFDDVIDMLQHRRLKYVCISPAKLSTKCSAVFIDNLAAAQALVAYLISLGHRRIGFIGGHPSYATSAQRRSGYRRALELAGIELDTRLEMQGEYDFRSGADGAAQLLALGDRPTAIFASSDDMAAGALATAHRLGLNVPGQLSIAGFDDTALAEVVWPPLTTIRQPTRELAYTATGLLLNRPEPVEHLEIPFELILRQSTAPRLNE